MADLIITLHSYNVYLIVLAGSVAGIWGLILYFTKKPANKPWHISLIVATVLGLLQGLFGITMVILGLKPGTGTGLYYLHYVYGAIVALAIPVGLTYTTSGKNPRRDILIFSIAALILVAAGVRAFQTGPH